MPDPTPLFATLTGAALLLAQDEGGGRGYTISWFIVLLSVILAMVVALRPAKREQEVRRPRD